MKIYKKLPLPEDTAWERFTIRKYINWRIKEFIDGVKNIFVWMPTIYKDKHWDHSYIYTILKKKIELQRAYIVHHNRHLHVDQDNYYMTVALNLIERCQEEYYGHEPFEYFESKMEFKPVDDELLADNYLEDDEDLKGASEVIFTTVSENLDEYLAKYPRVAKKLILKDSDLALMENKQRLALLVGHENQKKCRRLLFDVVNNNIERWWD